MEKAAFISLNHVVPVGKTETSDQNHTEDSRVGDRRELLQRTEVQGP